MCLKFTIELEHKMFNHVFFSYLLYFSFFKKSLRKRTKWNLLLNRRFNAKENKYIKNEKEFLEQKLLQEYFLIPWMVEFFNVPMEYLILSCTLINIQWLLLKEKLNPRIIRNLRKKSVQYEFFKTYKYKWYIGLQPRLWIK